MDIVVAGSMAYDRIMDFPEYFSDHILPDKIHVLNVCFQVNGVTENYGGTAGNIAYALKLMGESPIISATIGQDHRRYFAWLEQNSISTAGIRIIEDEFTAGAYITTDKGDNQITGFNPGAMKYSSELDVAALDPEQTIVIVSPGNLDDMIDYPRRCVQRNIRCVFDPGQALPVLPADGLREAIGSSSMLIVNDYELEMILNKTHLSKRQILDLAGTTVVTLGEKGSMLYDKKREVHVKAATPRKVVDPTGCGDAYRGGLLSGMSAGKTLEESARLGSVCASFAVECYGTQIYRFTAAEFDERLRNGI